MKILIVGGSKSGKSHAAQLIAKHLANGKPMIYWATMEATDDEDRRRIENHLIDRLGWGFDTVECGKKVQMKLPDQPEATVLFDSITAYLANEMFSSKTPDGSAAQTVLDGVKSVYDSFANTVFVCDEIFRDGIIYYGWTEEYKKALGQVLCSMAENMDVVIEATAGLLKMRKGRELGIDLEDLLS